MKATYGFRRNLLRDDHDPDGDPETLASLGEIYRWLDPVLPVSFERLVEMRQSDRRNAPTRVQIACMLLRAIELDFVDVVALPP